MTQHKTQNKSEVAQWRAALHIRIKPEQARPKPESPDQIRNLTKEQIKHVQNVTIT